MGIFDDFYITPEKLRQQRMQNLMMAPQYVQGNDRNARLGKFIAALGAYALTGQVIPGVW